MKNHIDTIIIDKKRYVVFLCLYFCVGLALVLFLVLELRLLSLGLTIFFTFMLVPFIAQKKFRRRFVKKAVINSYNDLFTIELFDNEDILLRKDENICSEIESFRAIDSSKDDSSYLRLNFKNGDVVIYNFLEQDNLGSKTNVLELIFNLFNAYNRTKEQYEKIVLKPNFFASKVGFFSIICLTILLIVSIFIEFFLKPQVIPFTLFGGLAFYLLIIAQRKRDVQQQKKMQ